MSPAEHREARYWSLIAERHDLEQLEREARVGFGPDAVPVREDVARGNLQRLQRAIDREHEEGAA